MFQFHAFRKDDVKTIWDPSSQLRLVELVSCEQVSHQIDIAFAELWQMLLRNLVKWTFRKFRPAANRPLVLLS